MFMSLFPQQPEFEGRSAVTFHNQRDYIFFRRHRYIFHNQKRVGLQELGPRFTVSRSWRAVCVELTWTAGRRCSKGFNERLLFALPMHPSPAQAEIAAERHI
jgi:hypothetical protein